MDLQTLLFLIHPAGYRDLRLFVGRGAGLRAIDHHRRGRYLPRVGGPARPCALAGGVQQPRSEFATDAPLHLGLCSQPTLRAGPGAPRRRDLYSCRLLALPEGDAGPPAAMAALRLPGLQPVHLRSSGGRARLRAGPRIPDVPPRSRGLHEIGFGILCVLLRLRGPLLRRQLFLRLRQRVRHAGDPRLRLRPYARRPRAPPAPRRLPATRAARVDLPERSCSASLAGRRTELRRAFAPPDVLHHRAGLAIPAESANRESPALLAPGARKAIPVAGPAGAGRVAMGGTAPGCRRRPLGHPGSHDLRALAALQTIPRSPPDGPDCNLDRPSRTLALGSAAATAAARLPSCST